MSAHHISVAPPPAEDLRAIVGAEHVRAGTAADAVDGVQPQLVITPGNEQELAKALACANEHGLAVIPRGGGTKLAWGNCPQRADVVLSAARMNRIIEHAASDLTVTVEAGCTMADLQRVLAAGKQRLALDPLFGERATVGGVLATNDSGTLRVRYGGLRDLIIGITLALPDGTLAKSGGKVVKNVAGYDLPKLATGSLGTLAIITQAVFRLHPLSRETRALTFTFTDAAQANQFLLKVLDSKLAYSGLQLRAAQGQTPEVDIRFEGTAAGVEAQCADVARLAGNSAGEANSAVWNARQQLFQPGAVVVKFATLPAKLASFCDLVRSQAEPAGMQWEIATQATGLGWLGVRTANASTAETLLTKLRAQLEPEGSLVVLQCPPEMKARFDVWGSPGDALALMRRVKHEFDPKGILNPGRFIGSI